MKSILRRVLLSNVFNKGDDVDFSSQMQGCARFNPFHEAVNEATNVRSELRFHSALLQAS